MSNNLFATAVRQWAETTTSATSSRYTELVGSKTKLIGDFHDHVQKPFTDVTLADLVSFQQHLSQRGLAQRTINSRLSLVRSFLRWAVREKLIATDPTQGLVFYAPTQPQAKSPLTAEQLHQLITYLDRAARRNDSSAHRDLMIVATALVTDLGRNEIFLLRRGDIQVESDSVTYNRRNRQEVIGTLRVQSTWFSRWMANYLDRTDSHNLGKDGPLWTRYDRAGVPGSFYSSQAFGRNLKQWAIDAGLPSVNLTQIRTVFEPLPTPVFDKASNQYVISAPAELREFS